MNTGVRQSPVVLDQAQRRARSNGERRTISVVEEDDLRLEGESRSGAKPRVFVAAENRLLREALSRMLVKDGDIEVAGMGKA
jgi:hypothetical protein